MPKQVYEKMGITETQQVLVIDGPTEAVAAIELPSITESPDLAFDHIILFTKSQSDLNKRFPQYKQRINASGKLWVAWPKAGRLGTNLNIKEVIRIGYNHGLVESTNLRIDDTWTALKFTHPKPGKTYKNSYGVLPESDSP